MLASIVRVLALVLMLALLAASRVLALDGPAPALGRASLRQAASSSLSSLPSPARG